MVDASSAFQDSLPVSSDDLLAQMRAAGVDFELYEHIPLRTVEDAKTVQGGAVPAGEGRIDIKKLLPARTARSGTTLWCWSRTGRWT